LRRVLVIRNFRQNCRAWKSLFRNFVERADIVSSAAATAENSHHLPLYFSPHL
jgi:hypothetical protein